MLKRTTVFALSLAAFAMAPFVGATAAEVNVYTTREPGLIKPLFDGFTAATGVQVKSIFMERGMAERVAAEGRNSPADILIDVDYGNLIDLVGRGLTQAIQSAALDAAVPANLRDPAGHWYALSMRARLIFVSKDRVADREITYENLADPRWKGKLCIRSGQHPYNTSLIAAMVAKSGRDAAQSWLAGMKANLGRKPGGGDRDVARDILAGICDIGVANSYYVGLMRSGKGGEAQLTWGNAVRVVMPTFKDGQGTHVNVSGAVVAKYSPNRANAIKLMEFLVSDVAQAIYAEADFEYPVKAGATVHPIIAALGTLKIDPLPLVDIAEHRKEASLLVDRVQFDN